MKIKIINESKTNNELRVITPENRAHNFTKLDDVKNAIFLAGPCPRDNYEDDWRNEAIEILKKLNFNGIVLNPTNKYYDTEDPEHLMKQTKWEVEAMHKASAIVFWIERSEEHPGYTTNIEFGDWYDKPAVFCGWTSKAIKNRYLDCRLELAGKKRYHSLEATLKAAVKDLNREPKRWFLSDTHFSQQRTLELSKRPFRDLTEMDLTLISNWNKLIRMNDEVYFNGDFGANFDYLNLLNYGKLYFTLGNYERFDTDKHDIKNKSIKALSKFENVEVHDRDLVIKLKNGKEVNLIHEPIDPNHETSLCDKLCIYGHIHGRTIYKQNGTDCAVDTHYYKPIDEDEIIWRLNAIQFLDENVWLMNCN